MSDAFEIAAPEIKTDRPLLRPLAADDAAAIFAYASDPEVARFTLWPPHRSLEFTARFVALFRQPTPDNPIGKSIRDGSKGHGVICGCRNAAGTYRLTAKKECIYIYLCPPYLLAQNSFATAAPKRPACLANSVFLEPKRPSLAPQMVESSSNLWTLISKRGARSSSLWPVRVRISWTSHPIRRPIFPASRDVPSGYQCDFGLHAGRQPATGRKNDECLRGAVPVCDRAR